MSGARWGAGFTAVGRFVSEIEAAATGKGSLKPGYVLAGDEIFLLDRCRDAVLKAFVPSELKDFCLSDLDLGSTPIFDVLDRAQIVGQQLQPHAFLGVELYQERLERRDPARHERGVVTSLTGAHRGVPTAREPAGRYRAGSRRAPVAYLLQEPALALRERPVGRRHEDDQVAARGEVAPWTYRS